MEIPKTLEKEILEYCKANKIKNIDNFTIKLIKTGLTIEKYGLLPEKVVKKPINKIKTEEIIEETPIIDDKITESTKKTLEPVKNDLYDED